MTAQDLLVRWQESAAATAATSQALEELTREHEQRVANERAVRRELARLIRKQPGRAIRDAAHVWTVRGAAADPQIVHRPEPRAAHQIEIDPAGAPASGRSACCCDGSHGGVEPGRLRLFPRCACSDELDPQFEADVALAQAWARNGPTRRRGA